MPYVDLQCGKVHYREQGRGMPLILLHANPGDGRDFSAIASPLAECFRVIALDWPGYGASPAPSPPASASAMFYFEALRQFVSAMKLPPAALIGNSVGGYAAARLALEEPDRVARLVLVSPGGFTAHNALSRIFCRLQSGPLSLRPDRFARLYLRRHTSVTREMLARARGEQATAAARSVNRAIWRSFIHPEHDLRGRAGTIAQPTLLIFGRFDPVIPARKDGREASRAMPHARFQVMETGHAPFAESPEEFLRVVTPFLRASGQ